MDGKSIESIDRFDEIFILLKDLNEMLLKMKRSIISIPAYITYFCLMNLNQSWNEPNMKLDYQNIKINFDDFVG